jgi:hypothetical protein
MGEVNHHRCRRQLNEGGRALAAAKLANIDRTDTLNRGPRSANLQDGKVSQSRAAELLNVSPRAVATAKKVIERGAPELVAAVESGANWRQSNPAFSAPASTRWPITTEQPLAASTAGMELVQSIIGRAGCGGLFAGWRGGDLANL